VAANSPVSCALDEDQPVLAQVTGRAAIHSPRAIARTLVPDSASETRRDEISKPAAYWTASGLWVAANSPVSCALDED